MIERKSMNMKEKITKKLTIIDTELNRLAQNKPDKTELKDYIQFLSANLSEP